MSYTTDPKHTWEIKAKDEAQCEQPKVRPPTNRGKWERGCEDGRKKTARLKLKSDPLTLHTHPRYQKSWQFNSSTWNGLKSGKYSAIFGEIISLDCWRLYLCLFQINKMVQSRNFRSMIIWFRLPLLCTGSLDRFKDKPKIYVPMKQSRLTF